MDTSQQGLISPPQIPMNIMMQHDNNKELVMIYAQIINSEKTLYRNVLRLYYSADYLEDIEYTEIPDEKGNMTKIPITKTKIVKLPSSDKICPICHTVYSGEEAGKKTHCTQAHEVLGSDGITKKLPDQKLEYLNWSPIFNENGFNKLMSLVLSGTDEIMSTGAINVPGEEKDEKMPLKEMAIRATCANISAITENTYEWSATGKLELTRGMYCSIFNMICDHYMFTMTRSKGKENLLALIAQSSKIFYNGSSGESGSQPRRDAPKRDLMSMILGQKNNS